MCVLLVNLTTLFVDGFGFEHDLDARIWILNPLKPVAGSQWHWGLRCLASIFGIRLIIFVFGDFCVFKEIFCGNASHPVVAFVSVVAFCGLLWSFVTSRCFCMMVCGAKCHFYGRCRILWYL